MSLPSAYIQADGAAARGVGNIVYKYISVTLERCGSYVIDTYGSAGFGRVAVECAVVQGEHAVGLVYSTAGINGVVFQEVTGVETGCACGVVEYRSAISFFCSKAKFPKCSIVSKLAFAERWRRVKFVNGAPVNGRRARVSRLCDTLGKCAGIKCA